MRLSPDYVRDALARAFQEDSIYSDVTTRVAVEGGDVAVIADLVAKASGVVAGIEVAATAFRALDPHIEICRFIDDGTRVESSEKIARIKGSAEAILTAERTALNFIQRMSGVATLTARYVAAVSGTGAVIVDTRKTVPGLRMFDKYGVKMGGGKNHRFSLADGVLIKDNHIALMRNQGMSITAIVAHARTHAPHTIKLEIEVETVSEAHEAIAADADIVMLDNMSIDDMRSVVDWNSGRAVLEASGGITLANARAVAETGVDLISVGELTHSPPAFDISLEFLVD